MAKTVAVINQKGGVGKTTTAFHMGTILEQRGNRVLYIDMDPQCNLSYAMDAFLEDESIFEVLMGKCEAKKAIQRMVNGDIIISNGNLSSYELRFHGENKEYRIRQVIESLKDKYDYIIIDSPPALSVLTIAILTASDSFIIPANSDSFSAQGIDDLHKTYEAIHTYTNASLKCDGVLLTRYIDGYDLENVKKVILTAHKHRFPIFHSLIHESLAIRGANAAKKTLFEYAPDSKALIDYTNFVDEWLRIKAKE